MKVTVKEGFVDKITRELYQPGQTVEISDKDRVADLLSRGLIEPVKAEKVETADKTPKRKK